MKRVIPMTLLLLSSACSVVTLQDYVHEPTRSQRRQLTYGLELDLRVGRRAGRAGAGLSAVRGEQP